MPEMIEIEGDLARFVDRRVLREVPITALLPHIETRLPVGSPVLPDRTRIFHLDPTNNNEWRLVVVVELDPAVRTLSLATGRWGRTREATHPRVAIPYTQFVFYLRSTDHGRNWAILDYAIFHSPEPVSNNTRQKFLPALLPNVYADARICFGNTAPRMPEGAQIHTRMNAIVNEFYLSDFTDHRVRDYFIPWQTTTTPSYGIWVARTTENPRCWLDWPEFQDTDTYHTRYTLEEILARRGPARTEPINLPDGIPDLAFNATFGRAEEWFRALNRTQQDRLITAARTVRGAEVTANA